MPRAIRAGQVRTAGVRPGGIGSGRRVAGASTGLAVATGAASARRRGAVDVAGTTHGGCGRSTTAGRSSRVRIGDRGTAAVGGAGMTTLVASSPPPTSSVLSSLTVGRRSGSTASARCRMPARRAGTPARSCSPRRMRSKTTASGPVPNGGRPVAANATVAAQPCTSVAGDGDAPSIVSRRQITRCSDDQSGRREPGLVDGSGQAEVDEDRPTVGEHNIARLDVAVDHSHRVHAPKGLGQTGGQPAEGREAKRPMVGDGPVERRAAHIAGDDVRRIAVDVGVENLRDSWPADPGQRRDLPAEPVRPSCPPTSQGRSALTATSSPLGATARCTTPIPPSPIRSTRR